MTRAARAAIAAGALAAGFTLAVVVVRLPPRAVLDLVGVDPVYDVRGGAIITYAPPPAMDPAQARAELAAWIDHLGGRLDPNGPRRDGVELAIPGIDDLDLDDLIATLVQAGLEFRPVVSDAPVMRELYRVAVDDPEAARLGVHAEVDRWVPDAGPQRTDYYLAAPSLAALRGYITARVPGGMTPEPGRELVFEASLDDAGQPTVRTYLVEATAVLDGRAIADATVSYDPYSNRPTVALELTRAGGERFAAVTAEHTGDKLATMLGGVVKSAPIINGPIGGGRAVIEMGGASVADREAEARALAATLRAGPLPRGGTVVDARIYPPNGKPGALWLARAACAVVIGAAAFALLLVLDRRTAPIARATGAAVRPRPWIPLVVTLTAIAVMVMGEHIALPGIGRERFADYDIIAGSQVSIFALGLGPLLTGFVIVELVAALAPRRAWRTTPAGRRRLAVATVIVGLAIAAINALAVARYVEALGSGAMIDATGTAPEALIVVTAMGGTLVLGLVAAVVSARGLGNGYAVLLGGGVVVGVVRYLDSDERAPLTAAGVGMIALIAAAVAIITRWLVTRRVVPADTAAGEGRAPPVPIAVAGIVPLVWLTVVVVPLGLLQLVRAAQATPVMDAVLWLQGAPVVYLATIAVLVVGLGAAWSGPRAPAPLVARMTQAAVRPAWRAWWIAAACGVVAVIALQLVQLTVVSLAPAIPAFHVLGLAILAAAVLDVVEDWRARRRAELVAVWPIHQVGMTEAVVQLLARAGIAPHLRGRHVRTLLHLFGPFVPIEVWVAPDRAAEATAILRDAFDPRARGVASAF